MRFTTELYGTITALLLTGACADTGSTRSSLSGSGAQAGDCTLTQGYWKNHEEAWPVASLELGNVTYTKAELLEILRTPVKGNGLISLAHQLIAAKLNIAAGADDGAVASIIIAADARIGDLRVGTDHLDTSAASALVDKLDGFNSGDIGPGHCDDAPNPPTCDTDDGGECDGSGSGSGSGSDCDHECDECDHDCDEEPPAPVCGNAVLETGEACDDGNTTAHDGCSMSCQIEVPLCGNGIREGVEECDDGNLVNGDGCSAACICDTPVP